MAKIKRFKVCVREGNFGAGEVSGFFWVAIKERATSSDLKIPPKETQ